MHGIVRGLVFILGLVIVLDAVIESPSSGLSIVVGCLLMGVISVDQIRELVQERKRNGEDVTP